MPNLPVAPVHYRIIQNGKQLFFSESVAMILTGEYTGAIGTAACFSKVRFLNFYDRRRGHDYTPEYFGGPATIEVLAPSGQVINRIALATAEDVATHPAGRVAYA